MGFVGKAIGSVVHAVGSLFGGSDKKSGSNAQSLLPAPPDAPAAPPPPAPLPPPPPPPPVALADTPEQLAAQQIQDQRIAQGQNPVSVAAGKVATTTPRANTPAAAAPAQTPAAPKPTNAGTVPFGSPLTGLTSTSQIPAWLMTAAGMLGGPNSPANKYSKVYAGPQGSQSRASQTLLGD